MKILLLLQNSRDSSEDETGAELLKKLGLHTKDLLGNCVIWSWFETLELFWSDSINLDSSNWELLEFLLDWDSLYWELLEFLLEFLLDWELLKNLINLELLGDLLNLMLLGDLLNLKVLGDLLNLELLEKVSGILSDEVSEEWCEGSHKGKILLLIII